MFLAPTCVHTFLLIERPLFARNQLCYSCHFLPKQIVMRNGRRSSQHPHVLRVAFDHSFNLDLRCSTGIVRFREELLCHALHAGVVDAMGKNLTHSFLMTVQNAGLTIYAAEFSLLLARSASFFACTFLRFIALLTLRMSGLPSLRIRTPSALRTGLVRVFLVGCRCLARLFWSLNWSSVSFGRVENLNIVRTCLPFRCGAISLSTSTLASTPTSASSSSSWTTSGPSGCKLYETQRGLSAKNHQKPNGKAKSLVQDSADHQTFGRSVCVDGGPSTARCWCLDLW
ncbi:hypothetical protein KCU85_g361, partial [Aureobasidium melanogenum]